MQETAIAGAKVALFIGAKLLVIRRDDDPDIPWPDHLDLPGGGCEAGESAEACVLRETEEEVGLRLSMGQLVYRVDYQRRSGRMAFFAAHLPATAEDEILFGDEGQGWALMAPEVFVAHREAVPHFREQVAAYLAKQPKV